MIVPDVNLLVYAYDADSRFHAVAKAWWQGCLSGGETVGLIGARGPGSGIRFWTGGFRPIGAGQTPAASSLPLPRWEDYLAIAEQLPVNPMMAISNIKYGWIWLDSWLTPSTQRPLLIEPEMLDIVAERVPA